MHQTDRTTLEAYPYMGESYFPQGEYGFAGEMDELVHPYSGEINQDLEVQFAAELLGVSNEEELDQFLGGFLRKVGSGFKRFASSGAGRAVFGALKSAAKVALPKLAGMAASMIPGVGPMLAPLASQAAGALGSKLGLEVEGMSNEDGQFEIARRIIRMGIDSARQIDALPEGEVMDEELFGAIADAARRYLPRAANAVVNGARSFAGNLSGNLTYQGPGGLTVTASRPPQGQHGQQGQQGYPGAAQGSNGQHSGRPQGGAAVPGRRNNTGRWVRTQKGILVLGV